MAIRLHEFTHRHELEQAVAVGAGDLAIGTRPGRWDGPINEIGWEQFLVVLPFEDPLLAEPGPVDLAQLSEREWVLYDREQGLAQLMLAACAAAGFQPRAAVETTQVEGAARFAQAGLGPALVPSDNIATELAGSARPLRWPVTRSAFTEHAQRFLALVAHSSTRRPRPRDAVVINQW